MTKADSPRARWLALASLILISLFINIYGMRTVFTYVGRHVIGLEDDPTDVAAPSNASGWLLNLQIPRFNSFQRNSSVSELSGSGTINMTYGLGPPGSGGEYVQAGTANFSDDIREKLRSRGLEPVEDHVFKSVYIETPVSYPVPKVQRLGNNTAKLKIISLYNAPSWYFGSKIMNFNRDFRQCPYDRCLVDVHADRVKEADLLVFFVGMLDSRPPPPRPRGQLWVKAFWEPPVNYGYPRNYGPWKSAFNLTFTMRLDSDIFAPNNRLGWRHRDMLLADQQYTQIAKSKRRPVAWWVSRCPVSSERMEYVKQMQKYIDVDIYGRCGSLKCPMSKMEECKRLLNTTYFFYLSFENSFCVDYVTEKFFRWFENRTHIIPVVRGGFNYTRYIPSGGYINAADFPAPKDLAMHLKRLMSDTLSYARMLREKDRLVALSYKHDWCQLCERLHTTGFKPKVIPDIKEWSHKNTCHPPTDVKS